MVCSLLTSLIYRFQEVRFNVLKAVAIVTSKHLNLIINEFCRQSDQGVL